MSIVIITILALSVLVLLMVLNFSGMKIKVLKKTVDKLSTIALHDSLTGLPNLALFNDRIDQAFLSVKRQQKTIHKTLLYIDVNNFKQINDKFGHGVGDKVLKTVARKLKEAVRSEDTVARLHGDEFAIILNGKHSTSAIKRLIKKFPINGIDIDHDKYMQVGISIGAVRISDSVGGVIELIQLADVAMYSAKRNCKDSGLMSGHQWNGVSGLSKNGIA